MYKLGRGNKRKGIGDFWRAKWGLTRCAMETGVVQGGVVLTLRANREAVSLGLGGPPTKCSTFLLSHTEVEREC